MVYLDHCATTKPYPDVIRAVSDALEEDFWNPASNYKPAKDVSRKMSEAFASLASDLSCEPDELIQTSGATEATNMALKGLFTRYGRRLDTLIASEADHDATLSTLNFLSQQGARVLFLKPLRRGNLDPEDLEQVLDEKTLCVSILWVNNETGTVQDLETLTELIRRKAPQAYIHVDMVQAWGRLDFRLRDLDIDLASFSAHKIHGPKGTGLLYKRRNVMLDPLIHGGGQQNGLRSGTDSWPLLAGMAKASEIQKRTFAERKERVKKLSSEMKAGLKRLGGELNFPEALPEIISVSFPGLRAETLIHMLDDQAVYVSNSSACQAGSKAVSHVLRALSLDKKKAQGTLRISLDASDSEEDVKAALEAIERSLGQLKAWSMY